MQHIELKKNLGTTLPALALPWRFDLSCTGGRAYSHSHPPPSSGEHRALTKCCTPRFQAGGEARPQFNETWLWFSLSIHGSGNFPLKLYITAFFFLVSKLIIVFELASSRNLQNSCVLGRKKKRKEKMQTVKSYKASTAKSFWIPIQLEYSSLGNDGSKPQTSEGMFSNPKQKSPGLCSSTAQACSSPSIYRPGAHITTIADCALQLFCISRRAGKNRLHFDLALFLEQKQQQKKAIRKDSIFWNHKGACSQSHSYTRRGGLPAHVQLFTGIINPGCSQYLF